MSNIKNDIKSVTFNDGYLYLMRLTDEEKPNYNDKYIFYVGIRTVTQKRAEIAAQQQKKIDMVLHIPYVASIPVTEEDVVLFRSQYYRVEAVEDVYTTDPPIRILTLRKWEYDYEGGDI